MMLLRMQALLVLLFFVVVSLTVSAQTDLNETSAPTELPEGAVDGNATAAPNDTANNSTEAPVAGNSTAPDDEEDVGNNSTAPDVDVDLTLADAINERTLDESDGESLSLFKDALEAVGLLDTILSNTTGTYTVFAPTNAAIQASSEFQLFMQGLDGDDVNATVPRFHYNLLAALNQHIVTEVAMSMAAIFDGQLTEIASQRDAIAISQFEQHVQHASITDADIWAVNGVLHVVDKVFQPAFFTDSFMNLELQEEYGPDHLGRTAMTDVVDFVDAREVLNHVRPEGQTFVGCRIRAFNRLEEYLPQTINESPLMDVIQGEFLNETFKNETIHNFIEYSLIPKNYYLDDIPNGFVQLTVPIAKCGHMWVTKNDDKLCFNNGCVVETPDPRQFYASNGIGYVIDKCQVCPGIAMLTDVASEYTIYNTLDVAQFFRASEWNLRDLRLSVGDGSDLTLFASINTGWSIFNTDDTTRLAGDEWKPHQLDMLSHMLVQGRWTEQDLKDKFETVGPYNLTSLLNQSIPVDYDSETKLITIAGGGLFFPDIQGVDGLVHFTDALPLPRSVTHSIYDIANEDPRYTTQITYIDTVYLDADMKRLLPLTALYAPNEEWEGKKTEMEEIAKKVLKSHMFEKLYWCDRLRNETNVTSLNGQNWAVSVNDDNFPCFEPLDATGVVAAPLKTCITKCDILARNGIVHELDTLMMYEAAETRSPSEFIGSAPNATDLDIPAGQPTVFKRPTSSGASAPASAPDIEPDSTEKSSANLLKPARILSALAILSCVMFLG